MAGGELFTHLYQREHFTEEEVRIYIGEIILALERLHSVSMRIFNLFISKCVLIFPAYVFNYVYVENNKEYFSGDSYKTI